MSELCDILSRADIERDLDEFIRNNSSVTSFPSLTNCKRKQAWGGLFAVVKSNPSVSIKEKALISCRLLSRDSTGINECIENTHVELLIETLMCSDNAGVGFEAKKVLSNLIHQSAIVRAYCTQNGFLEKVLNLVKNHKAKGEIERFDLRLVFLLTTLCPEQRLVANQQLGSLSTLNSTLSRCCEITAKDTPLAVYVGEVLKVLFNLTIEAQEEDGEELRQICTTIKTLLVRDFESEEANDTVVSNIVNFLTNLDGKPELTSILFPDNDMANIQKILDFLLRKLEKSMTSSQLNLKEEVAPSLSVLWSVSKMHRHTRKYLKNIVLPPLTARDIQEKPEKGSSVRSRLVALLTNPDPEVATMTAEFLFVLCKHNVGRLVKHSGYGNAAGLLARRGLLQGGRGEGDFSADEESDTEDYQKEAHKVNPITGCIEEERKNPLEGMTDEQKEYEAMKLVNMMDQLMKGGLIQPATVGPDGKPVPVDHILQMTEGIEETREID